MVTTRDDYDRQFERLQIAIDALLKAGCYLHAIARAYSQVHLTAEYAAFLSDMTIERRRQGESQYQSDYSHNEMADVIRSLYDGQRHGKVVPGTGSGITSSTYTPIEAAKKMDQLQRDRKDADYGPTAVLEPYTADQAGERLKWAKTLVEDLRRLI